jgi:type I restriction-modification system DNA methylase subunit
MPLFQNSVLNKYLKNQDAARIQAAYSNFTAYFHNPERQANIRAAKEEQFQEGFMRELFVNILGYTLNPEPNYNLTTELKNLVGSKKADGAILSSAVGGASFPPSGGPRGALAVIELKGTDTTDLDKINAQAFAYKNNHPGCQYIITSNFEKLRFYIQNAVEHIEFNLFTLTETDFNLLWLCLQADNLLSGIPLKAKEESLLEEENITKKLYKDYSAFKNALWQSLVQNHPQHNPLDLFKKTQKLLDRFLFVFFAEDKGLLPPNSISRMVERYDKLKDEDAYKPLYHIFKQYFGYLNIGRKGKTAQDEIFAYNGGLFLHDDFLDAEAEVDDAILHPHIVNLTNYDFASEVDVNILGHIFEHSLNEIESISAQLEGQTADLTKSKRKKDGVFYTPKYITKYIVENTVGRLCADKKAALGLVDEDYSRGRSNRKKETIKQLDQTLQAYRQWLLGITIVDPACGSGAFLNQALDFLMDEHSYIDALEGQLLGHAFEFPGVENHILEKNIYGVDINEEGVEIAKLSLWLRTAKKGRKLSSLNKNLKCGNSLISDPAVAGDKAFDWQQQFPEVFANGGFDVVIGNPPYVDIKALDPVFVRAFFKLYQTCENRINLYAIFIEKGYSILRSGGVLSFINPNSILINSSYTSIRKLLIDDVTSVVKLPDNVFVDAKVETIIFELTKDSSAKEVSAILYPKDENITFIDSTRRILIDKANWKSNQDYNFNIFISKRQFNVLRKIESVGTKLGEIAKFSLGITPYDKYQGHSEETISSRIYHSDKKLDETYKPLISGANIIRYGVSNKVNEYIKYGPWLGAMREESFFTEPRILVRQIVSSKPPRIFAGYTEESLYFTQIGFGIIPSNDKLDCLLLLSILNSSLITFYHKFRFLDLEKELFQKILIANCKQLPVVFDANLEIESLISAKAKKIITLIQENNLAISNFIELIESKFTLKLSQNLQNWPSLDFKGFLAELKKAKVKLTLPEEAEWLPYFTTQKEKANALHAQITQLDKEIDQMVYQLYGLTEEEIKIVEGV